MMFKGLILDRIAVPANHQVNPVNNGRAITATDANHVQVY